MPFDTVGPSLQSAVGENVAEFHNFVLANGTIWAFSLTYHKQEKFSWGHRVIHQGGYAIPYDTKENQWGKVQEFPALTTEENTEEVLFELGSEVYLLLHSNFGEIKFHSLYKWTGNSWAEVTLQAPAVITSEWDRSNVDAHIVADTSSTDRYVVVNLDRNMHLFKLNCNGNNAVIELVAPVPEEANLLGGKATSGIHSGSRVIICFMVMGCGYRWENMRFIVYDEETKQFEHVVLPDDSAAGPTFCFTGATSCGISPNGDWIHAGGQIQVGMTGSAFDGAIWALKNLSGEPKWEKLELIIPEEFKGASLIDSASGDIYQAEGSAVAKASLL